MWILIGMKESDLYPPLKRFLEKQDYEVKGEVDDCDVVAIRGDESPVIIELKLSLNLGVVLQAVDRIALTHHVYIGVPESCATIRTKQKQVFKMLRMLGLGLLAIDGTGMRGRVTVLLDPAEYKPRKSKARRERLLGEFTRRVGDPNLGGKDKRRGTMTVYRQRALAIGLYLEEHGATKASVIAEALGDTKARALLYQDVYGWFERLGQGVYDLSLRGKEELRLWQ